jgi:hypothetical protein
VRRRIAAAVLAAALAAPLAAGAETIFQKGFTLGGWSRDDHARPELAAQLRALADGGVEWVAFTARWLQAERTSMLYRAALEAFWGEPWFAGFYWWMWDTRPPADPERDASFTPQGKPAWPVLREFYRRSDR